MTLHRVVNVHPSLQHQAEREALKQLENELAHHFAPSGKLGNQSLGRFRAPDGKMVALEFRVRPFGWEPSSCYVERRGEMAQELMWTDRETRLAGMRRIRKFLKEQGRAAKAVAV